MELILIIDYQAGFSSGFNEPMEGGSKYRFDMVDGSGMTAQMLCQEIAES